VQPESLAPRFSCRARLLARLYIVCIWPAFRLHAIRLESSWKLSFVMRRLLLFSPAEMGASQPEAIVSERGEVTATVNYYEYGFRLSRGFSLRALK
jgi:hypothetical protein